MPNDSSSGADLLPLRGISMSTYSQAGYDDSSIASLIDRAVANGANYVVLGNIVLADLQTGKFSDVIENGHNQTASLDSVGHAVAVAEAAGLAVVLKPQVAVYDAAFDQYNSASWINMVNPDLKIANPDAFFANYKAQLLDWASLAQRSGVDTLSIGNEMVAATKPEYTHYWLDIIDAVREVYDGKLTYAALAPVIADSATNEITQIGFWHKLDYAGFDVYPSLVHTTTPTVEQLNAGWYDATVYGHQQDYAAFLGELAAFVEKPVVFTETGLPSFDGASDREATSDGTIGAGTRATDQGEQADWWQSFFETWSAHPLAWLQGVFVTNNDPGDLGSYYDQNYNVNGKLAEGVITSYFGGHIALGANADALVGSQADDQLYLYDPAIAASGSSRAEHLTTTVKIVLTAGIAGGQAPVIHAVINGVDFGKIELKPYDSGYIADNGTHFTTNATYSFTLPGLVTIDQLKIAFDSPVIVGGQRSSTFFHSVSVNGVALSGIEYHPDGQISAFAQALPDNGAGGTSSQWGGGYSLIDASPWNKVFADNSAGSAGHPIAVQGGAGTDTLHVLGNVEDYTVVRTADGSVNLREVSGHAQNADLIGIEYVVFGDASIDLARLAGGGVHAAATLAIDLPLGSSPAPGETGAPPVTHPATGEGEGAASSTGSISQPENPAVTPPATSAVLDNGSITGSVADDVLYDAGDAPATLIGGYGNDTYLIRHANDTIIEYGDQGNDIVFSAINYALNGGAVVEILSTRNHQGTDPINLVGNYYAQQIIGNFGDNLLNGNGGADTLIGLKGNDTYAIADPDAVIVESVGEGRDIVFTRVSYELTGTAEIEALSFTDQRGYENLHLIGNQYDQLVIGNFGNNVLNGNGGVDTLIGLIGDDIYAIDDAHSAVLENAGEGIDTVFTSVSYTLTAGSSIEVVSTRTNAGLEPINLTGNDSGQVIIGNYGANIIDGGAGADTLYGLGGADTFSFSTTPGSDNIDVIADFESEIDTIQLSARAFGSLAAGTLPASAFIAGTSAMTANQHIVYDQTTGHLFYDADGSGAGAALLFATMTPYTMLTESSLMVV